MSKRTFGWIQDAGKLTNLKKVIKEFALLDKIGIIDSHKKISEILDIGRWANENYTRLAEALGFIEYDREYDTFSVSDLGIELISAKNSNEENNIIKKALLTYPPACRILQLLLDEGHLSKFEIGEKLGFQNERGFLHYSLENYIIEYDKAENKNKIVSNKESTVDKYARMIAGYLVEVGWANQIEKELKYNDFTAKTPHAYIITDEGRKAFRRSVGSSKEAKVIKNVSYEMLASRKQLGSKFLRDRRALILESLQKKKGKFLTFSEVEKYIIKNNSEITENEFQIDLLGFENIGLQITKIGKKVTLNENLNLNFPIFTENKKLIDKQILKLIKNVSSTSKNIQEQFISKIITEAFSGKELCKEFEKSVFQLFNELIGFEGIKLGGHFKREPDSLHWYKVSTANQNYGLIIDAKAYSKGFRLNTDFSRQMMDYIFTYTKILEKEHEIDKSYYLWVVSKFAGSEESIKLFSDNVLNRFQFQSRGAIISIINSLLIAEIIKEKSDLRKLENVFSICREIQENDILRALK